MAFKDFVSSMLQDERGSTSSKRVVAIIGALVLYIAFLFHIPVNNHLADLITGIVGVGLGLTTWDKFSLNKNNP